MDLHNDSTYLLGVIDSNKISWMNNLQGLEASKLIFQPFLKIYLFFEGKKLLDGSHLE